MPIRAPSNAAPSSSANKILRRLDILLLLMITVLVSGRCLINEAFPLNRRLTGPSPGPLIASGETTAMIVFATLIFTALLVWLFVRIRSGISWRKTSLVGPLILFIIAAIISSAVASDKNRAVVGVTNLLSQIAAAVLLVQLLDAPWKRRLLACAIIAGGATQAYRCWEQHHYDFNEAIRNYEADPQRALAAQNIEPGTYAAEQFKERLYSRDVGGYFAISNTAAAFFILSLSITLAMVLRRWNKANLTPMLLGVGLLAVQLFGLALTQSKGGIAAFGLAVSLTVVLWTGRRFLTQHQKAAFVGTIMLITLAVGAIIIYGLRHDRLPTNSMWVRWQYWTAGAEMIRDHGLTGVGAENFGRYYPRYMNPAAPEVVSDPHSFPLAIWTQWGVLGFAAMLWTIGAVAWRVTPKNKPAEEIPPQPSSVDKPPLGWWPWILALSTGVFILRRATSDLSSIVNLQEKQSVILISFLVPAVIWLIAFLAALGATQYNQNESLSQNKTSGAVLILGCGLLGFLLHNSIDFAIFQPGVGLLLLATTALLLSYHVCSPEDTYNLARKKVLVISIAAALLLGVYLNRAVPIARSQGLLDKAQRLEPKGDWTAAQSIAKKTTGPEGWQMLTELAMMRWVAASRQTPAYLAELQTCYFPNWISADPENFKVYLTIGEFYRQAAQNFPDHQEFRDRAIDYYQQALARHPHKAEMLIAYAELLIDAGRNEQAAAALKKALAAEDAFLDQQRRMYPDRTPLRPRLEPVLREHAQSLLNTLSPPREN
ncbi:MAG: O-antigen ligase family protein [Sedimentisphaerales bacterium]|nr:O-antigen ligase family protein [Sedimentisphaerales bacterium]